MRLRVLVVSLFLCALMTACTALPAATMAADRSPAPMTTAASSAAIGSPTTPPASSTPPAATEPPTPPPTATPEPTPTPDPWAQYFTAGDPVLKNPRGDRGPWVYRDGKLSITVTVPKEGRLRNKYCMAEIFTRGPMPAGGFANKDQTGRSATLPTRIAKQNNAVLAITGDYIRCSYNKKGVMIRGGVVFYDKKDAPTMAFLPSGEMKLYEPGAVTAQQLLDLGVRDSFAFGPILVQDGKVHPSVAQHKLNYHSYRAAIGQVAPGHFILIGTRAAVTLTELANLFVDLGCTCAYNMDGGYSAAMVFMGKQINKDPKGPASQRSLPDILMIGCLPADGKK